MRLDELLALTGVVAGVATIYVTWRSTQPWTRATRPIGWLLLVVAPYFWVRAAGAELGLAFGAMAVTFAAWIAVALGGDRSAAGRRRYAARADATALRWSAVASALARSFVALPLAGAASVLASVAFVAPLPWDAADRYVFAVLVVPVVWGLLAMWAAMTERLVRTGVLFACASAACAAVLFLR